MKRRGVYPFTAIVGQEDMKLSLILNVINPALGGVLIKGEKGTAKSTAVRALAELLPAMEAVKGCRFHCDPAQESFLCDDCTDKFRKGELQDTETLKMRVVELPVSATEDRVVGTLDVEYAIKNGEKKFEPGLLALANRNILYVDEINLLDDHVVDVLLDAAAMGVNTVEREGVSYSHPARDRFALSVTVTGEHDRENRKEVIKRRLAYEADPEGFIDSYGKEQEELAGKIVAAGKLLPEVTVADSMLDKVADLAIDLGVDGHRSDITLIKTAMTMAAFRGSSTVETEDLKIAARLALPHRMRRRPFEDGTLDMDKVLSVLEG